MNLIIMKNGKSKLLENLAMGDTLIIIVGVDRITNILPIDVDYYKSKKSSIMGVWEELDEESKEYLKYRDRVIFYSNSTYNIFSNREGVTKFNQLLGEDRTVYMFGSFDTEIKTNKFWYSEKQRNVLNFNFRERPCTSLVKTENGWKEYTELCSDGSDSNWDDATLVFESKDKPQIDTNNCHKSTCTRCRMLKQMYMGI